MPATDEFKTISPADNAFNIVQDADFAVPTKGIYVGASGNLQVIMVGGGTVTFVDIVAGVVHPLRIIQVLSAGTTATGLIGLT